MASSTAATYFLVQSSKAGQFHSATPVSQGVRVLGPQETCLYLQSFLSLQ